MTAQNHAPQIRLVASHRGDLEGELEAGSPPREPSDLVSVATLGQLLTVLGGRQGDHRIGVEMVDVVGSSNPCMAVSMLGAAPGAPKPQWSSKDCISSSCSSPDRRNLSARNRSSRSSGKSLDQ